MLASRPARTSACSQRHLPQLEVLLEFLPFLVGGLAVFFGGPGSPPLVEERPVGADQVVLEDGHVRFRSGQVFVAENPGCDVHGQPAGDGCRREAPAETPTRMGHADGRPPPQDPRRLPRLPRGHPRRTSSTAITMSTGEPAATQSGHGWFGGGPSEKDQVKLAPRRRPTLRPVRFGGAVRKNEPRTAGTSPYGLPNRGWPSSSGTVQASPLPARPQQRIPSPRPGSPSNPNGRRYQTPAFQAL